MPQWGLTKDYQRFDGCTVKKGTSVEDCNRADHGICEEERKRTTFYQRFVSLAGKSDTVGMRNYLGPGAFPLPVAFLNQMKEKA